MPKQIRRLIIVFLVFIALFLVFRAIVIPDSFKEYGYYRGDALEEIASQELHYAGTKSCLDCHDSIVSIKSEDLHEEIACETCHGPALKHVKDQENNKVFKPHTREFCGRCHSQVIGRPIDVVSQIDLKEHNTGKICIKCHNPHAPWLNL